MTQIVPQPVKLAKLVYLICGEKVLLDADLAMLYGVETGELTRYDEQFSQVFDAIKQLISEDKTRKAKRPNGFP
jgi:hypothetical protein